MTNSFPTFDINEATADTGLVDGDSYYTGNKRLEWVQPDPGDDGGYWEESNIPNRSILDIASILERLAVVEAALNITPAEP